MKNYNTYSEKELQNAIAEGDLQAFNEFYNRYVDNLIHFVHGKLDDLEESKDIVQEIFVTIWREKEAITLINSISSYLYRIAINKSLNIFRRGKIEAKYIASLGDYLANQQVTLEEISLEAEQEKTLQNALKELPEKMRLIFELRYYKGKSNQEIADLLNISIQTVSTQMKRALKTIRKHTQILVFMAILINL